MIAVLSLLLRCLLLFGVLVTANVVAPSTAWGYDAQPQPSTAYDGASLSAFDYDTASALAICEKQNGATGNRVLFAEFAKFLAAKTVATPHGPAVQAMTAEAQAALRQVQSGSTVFRQGEFGVQNTLDAQFWGLRNPATTPGFAGQFGMPGSAAPKVDWIMGGTVRPGSSVITRPAPGIGGNLGGSMEAVVPPGGVRIDWFHMP